MEKLVFSFDFKSNWSLTPPTVEIVNNNIQLCPPTEIKEPTLFTFDIDIPTSPTDSCLKIIRGNHNGATSQTCHLVSLTVDGIDLHKILDHTKFYPAYPSPWYEEQLADGKEWPEFHQGWVEWGWNGIWEMSYTTPFYDWLLKKL